MSSTAAFLFLLLRIFIIIIIIIIVSLLRGSNCNYPLRVTVFVALLIYFVCLLMLMEHTIMMRQKIEDIVKS